MTQATEDLSRTERLLHAYHDGELTGLARWRFERALRRSPALRRELAGLTALSGMLREHEASRPTPDLWEAIALRLPAADARRGEPAEAEAAASPWLWWLKPVGAMVATAAVAAVMLWMAPGAETPGAGGVVRWIDTGERSVMVLDDQPDTTIIWVLDAAPEGAGRRSGREHV